MPVPRTTYKPDVRGPLYGVRIVDLTRLFSGGTLTLTLADLGAEVTKIEPPKHGDPLRTTTTNGFDAFWRVYGRNKKAITLDLKTPRGREILLELVEVSDILAENFTPGTLERLDLAPETLLKRNPKLVIARVSGWGQTGPYSHKPGFGTLAESAAGFTALNGYADRPPLLAPLPLGDGIAGLYGATAVLAALHNVNHGTGEGQVVDISLFEPLLAMMGPDSALTRVRPRQRGDGNRASSLRGVFQTKDEKWVAVSAATNELVLRFLKAFGREDVLDDPRFADYTSRIENKDALNEIVAAQFTHFTREQLLSLADEHDITIGPVYTVLDQFEDPHFEARASIVEVEGDDADDAVLMHNIVPRFSRTPGAIRLPAPGHGQHNHEVLAGLGLDANAIASLESDGVI